MTPTLEISFPWTEEERIHLYGYRDLVEHLPNGRVLMRREALTLEDLLHPTIGDYAVESSLHDQERHYLASVFRSRLDDDPLGALVLSDCGIYWDDPELKHHSPDVTVILGIQEKRLIWSSFSVREQGTRPTLLVEIVSPDYRVNDVVTKVAQYYRAGVPWYLIVDREKNDDVPALILRRHQPDGWEIVVPDATGRIWLPRVNVWLEIHDGQVACYDGHSGERLGDYSAVRRELAEARVKEEARKAQMVIEIDARRAPESRANAEAAARRQLEAEIALLKAEIT